MLDRDLEVLKIMLKHTNRINYKIKGISLKQLNENEDLQQILAFNILQIGELSNGLTDEFKNKYKNIPWKNIYGMRNIIVHGYSAIDLETIYDTSINSIPELENKILKILNK